MLNSWIIWLYWSLLHIPRLQADLIAVIYKLAMCLGWFWHCHTHSPMDYKIIQYLQGLLKHGLLRRRNDWHTHTCLSLLQGTLERRLNRTVSVNICQMSIFPLPLQLKGANLPHNFLSRHGGFELARCRFSSKSAHHYCLGKQLFSNTLRILSR